MRHWCFITTSLMHRLIGRIASPRPPGLLPQGDGVAGRGQSQPRGARPAEFAFCDLTIDETHTKVAGKPVYVYRAIDGRGQVVDVFVSRRRAAADAAAFFRRAIASTGVVPDEVTTDGAAAYPPALAAVLPGTLHEAGKTVQQRIERDHQHLKGRLRPLRGFKTLAGARVLCRGHAFLRNLRAGFYDLGRLADVTVPAPLPRVVRAWATLTGALLGR
jgi:hypothetical protein